MTSATAIALGVLVVLLVVGGLIWLARTGRLEPKNTNAESPAERDEMQAHRESFNIPASKRIGAWSGPRKAFFFGLAALGVVGAATGYFALKTGSPVKTYVPDWGYVVAVGLFGVGAGVRLDRYFDDMIGTIDVVYEQSDGPPKAEQIEFAKTRVGSLEGNPKVPEVADRLFGLFPRYRLVGEHKELRGSQKPLGDILEIAIPDHGVEMPNGDYHVTTKAEGEILLTGATSRADITYGSTNSLSDERAQEIRSEKNQLEARNRTLSALNAELNSQVRTMSKRLENEDYKTREELVDDFERFSDIANAMNVKISDDRGNGKRAGEENGESQEAGA